MKSQFPKIFASVLMVALTLALSTTPALAYKAGKVANGGTITGKITYKGEIPMKRIVPTKNREVCGKVRKRALVNVGDGDGVANVVIFIKKIAKGKPWPKGSAKAELNQLNCIFRPHVQVVRAGKITIINSDPVLHNTHGYYGRRTAFNMAMPDKGQRIDRKLKREGLVRVDCDAHGWMEGWMYVLKHPYFAISGSNGSFSITNVPAGTYKLVVWQEFVGTKEISVTVKAGKTASANLELKES